MCCWIGVLLWPIFLLFICNENGQFTSLFFILCGLIAQFALTVRGHLRSELVSDTEHVQTMGSLGDTLNSFCTQKLLCGSWAFRGLVLKCFIWLLNVLWTDCFVPNKAQLRGRACREWFCCETSALLCSNSKVVLYWVPGKGFIIKVSYCSALQPAKASCFTLWCESTIILYIILVPEQKWQVTIDS